MSDFERDLWWEARQHTQSLSPQTNPILTRMMSLTGRPTQPVFSALSLGREKSALVVDLNKYRPGRDLKKFVDAGVDAFILRMGGPTQWVDGDYKYQEDATWRPYMEQADKIGFANRVMGYWIQNVFEDWNLNGLASNVTLQLINEWTSGGYMPPAFVCDHEVAECYRSTGAKFQQTPINLTKSLDATTDKVYKQWKKTVGIYSARWFMDKFARSEHAIYFDNINKPESLGGPGTQRPLWMAWVPQTFSKEYANLEDTLGELLIPTGTQTANLLSVGSYSTAALWQYTFTLKLPGDSTGVDASVSLGTKEDFFNAFGLTVGATPPPPPPPPDVPPTDTTIPAKLALLETQVQALNQFKADLTNWHKTFPG